MIWFVLLPEIQTVAGFINRAIEQLVWAGSGAFTASISTNGKAGRFMGSRVIAPAWKHIPVYVMHAAVVFDSSERACHQLSSR